MAANTQRERIVKAGRIESTLVISNFELKLPKASFAGRFGEIHFTNVGSDEVVVKNQFLNDRNMRGELRALVEIDRMARLGAPCFPLVHRVFDGGTNSSSMTMSLTLMEAYSNINLDQYLRGNNNKHPPKWHVISMFSQCAHAYQLLLDRNLVHGDLECSNVLLRVAPYTRGIEYAEGTGPGGHDFVNCPCMIPALTDWGSSRNLNIKTNGTKKLKLRGASWTTGCTSNGDCILARNFTDSHTPSLDIASLLIGMANASKSEWARAAQVLTLWVCTMLSNNSQDHIKSVPSKVRSVISSNVRLAPTIAAVNSYKDSMDEKSMFSKLLAIILSSNFVNSHESGLFENVFRDTSKRSDLVLKVDDVSSLVNDGVNEVLASNVIAKRLVDRYWS